MKRETDNYSGVMMVSLIFILAIGPVVLAQSSAGQSGRLERRAIEPNNEIQCYLKALISTNKQVMFEGTEESVLERFRQLRKMAGQDKDLVSQLMYFHAHANDMEEAMLPGVILEQLGIPNSAFFEACLPMLDSEDESTRKMGEKGLSRADHNPNGGVDFNHYETILREKKQNPPQSLLRYMYGRNPAAAVVTVARVYGQDVPEPEVAAKARGGVKESLDYFAGRPEWWAHLYVAAMIEQAPHLQTP